MKTRLELAGMISIAVTIAGGFALITGLMMIWAQKREPPPRPVSREALTACAPIPGMVFRVQAVRTGC